MDWCESTFAHARLRQPVNGRMSKYRTNFELATAPSLKLHDFLQLIELEDRDWQLPLAVPVPYMQDGIFHTSRHYQASVDTKELKLPPEGKRKPASTAASDRQVAAKAFRQLVRSGHVASHLAGATFPGQLFGPGLFFFNTSSRRAYMSLGFRKYVAALIELERHENGYDDAWILYWKRGNQTLQYVALLESEFVTQTEWVGLRVKPHWPLDGERGLSYAVIEQNGNLIYHAISERCPLAMTLLTGLFGRPLFVGPFFFTN